MVASFGLQASVCHALGANCLILFRGCRLARRVVGNGPQNVNPMASDVVH